MTRIERKIMEIAKNGSAATVQPKKTLVPETELNSFLNYNLKEKIPRGLTNPHLSMLGNGQPRPALCRSRRIQAPARLGRYHGSAQLHFGAECR